MSDVIGPRNVQPPGGGMFGDDDGADYQLEPTYSASCKMHKKT